MHTHVLAKYVALLPACQPMQHTSALTALLHQTLFLYLTWANGVDNSHSCVDSHQTNFTGQSAGNSSRQHGGLLCKLFASTLQARATAGSMMPPALYLIMNAVMCT